MQKLTTLTNKTLIVLGLSVTMLLTGCGSISNGVKSILADDSFPPLPKPELTTYILDLSGSTNALGQLAALRSGIDEFVSGTALGNPFSSPRIEPKGLSMQFISMTSGQAPRFLLVSAETGQELYAWMTERLPNLDQAKPLWDGFIKAREVIYSDGLFNDLQSCPSAAISIFGQQALSAADLRYPAILICKDAAKTSRALDALEQFKSNPMIPMGSDVFGALNSAINNMRRASDEFGSSRKVIAIASDMVDENKSRGLIQKLRSQDNNACELGKSYSIEDFGDNYPLSDFRFVLVGVGNTSMYRDMISENRKFWACYFEAAGAEVEEATDLAGY